MESNKNLLTNVLQPFQEEIEKAIGQNMLTFGKKTELYSACEYALLNGGKRFRPVIVYMVAKALKSKVSVLDAALAVEYFHTASLIADDFPCMDNDEMRRGKPSLHKVYGEAISMLATYALIAAGYGCIAKNSRKMMEANVPNAALGAILAVENASYNTGILGATGGQYLDLFVENCVKEANDKKTGSLFEISFVFGFIFGGGDIHQLDEVKRAAAHFGTAFQIADDIEDFDQDIKSGSKANTAINYGKKKAVEMLENELLSFFSIIEKLGLESEDFKNLTHTIYQK